MTPPAAGRSDAATDGALPAAAGRHTPPAPLANGAWEAVMAAHAGVMRRLAATDLWDEVSLKEYDVIYTLSKCAKPVRQSELSRHVLLSQPAISRLVDRLVARSLIARRPDPTDGRGVCLTVTDAGRAVQRRIGARHARDVTRALTDRLTRDEIAELGRLASKLAGPFHAD